MDLRAQEGDVTGLGSFNPSVGILLVWTSDAVGALLDGIAVSIPRSGFCWFGLAEMDRRRGGGGRFNPSVGILLVWTLSEGPVPIQSCEFQSLGRDSVGLDWGNMLSLKSLA